MITERGLTEQDLTDLGFSKHQMAGTGWNSISSMQDAIYYYKKGRITINATTIWTWFLDGEQRNDIAVETKEQLERLAADLNKGFELEVVCPKWKTRPVPAQFVRSSTMEREVWEAVDDGLSGKEVKKWKSIVVKCSHCGEEHEYALTQNPK